MQQTLQYCQETFLMPCVYNIPSDTFVCDRVLAENALKLFLAIYEGSDISAADASSNRWDAKSVKRMFIFACTWTFGICSPTARSSFGLWYRDLYEKLVVIEPELNPPGPNPFDYFLSPQHEDDVSVVWTHWSAENHFSPLTDMAVHSHCTVYTSNSILVPTPTTQALASLQRHILKTGGHLIILGQPSTGKSAALRYLATQTDHNDRYLCFIKDKNPRITIENLNRSRTLARPLLLEKNLPMVGSIFIDDVSVQSGSVADQCGSSSELLRSIAEFSKYFNPADRRWISVEGCFTAMCCRYSQAPSLHRLLRHCFVVCTDSDMSDVLTSKLCKFCPNIKDNLASDLVTITSKLVEKLNVTLVDTDLSNRASALRPVVESVIHVLEALSVMINRRPNVIAIDSVISWQFVINTYFAEFLSGSNIFNDCIDDIINSSVFQFSGFNEVLLLARKKAPSTNPMKKKVVDLVATSEEINRLQTEGEHGHFFAFMDWERLASFYDINYGEYGLPATVDSKSSSFWMDVQKIGVTCLVPTSHYMVVLGSTLSVVTGVLTTAARLAGCEYVYQPLVDDVSKFSLTNSLIEKFTSVLRTSELHDQIMKERQRNTAVQGIEIAADQDADIKLNSEAIDNECAAVISTLNISAPNPTGDTLWHLHLDHGSFTKDLWACLNEAMQLNSEKICDRIFNLVGLDIRSSPLFRKALSEFMNKQKVVITLGVMVDKESTIQEMTKISNILNKFRVVYTLPYYGVDMTRLKNAFGDSMITRILDVFEFTQSLLMETLSVNRSTRDFVSSKEYSNGGIRMLLNLYECAHAAGDAWTKKLATEIDSLCPIPEEDLNLAESKDNISLAPDVPEDNLQSSSVSDCGDVTIDPDNDTSSVRSGVSTQGGDTHLGDILFCVLLSRYLSIVPMEEWPRLSSTLKNYMYSRGIFVRERYDTLALATTYYHFKEATPEFKCHEIKRLLSKLRFVPNDCVLRNLVGVMTAVLMTGESILVIDLSYITLYMLVDIFGLVLSCLGTMVNQEKAHQLGTSACSPLIDSSSALFVIENFSTLLADSFILRFLQSRSSTSIYTSYHSARRSSLHHNSSLTDISTMKSLQRLKIRWHELSSSIQRPTSVLMALMCCLRELPQSVSDAIWKEILFVVRTETDNRKGEIVIAECLQKAILVSMSYLRVILSASEYLALEFGLLLKLSCKTRNDFSNVHLRFVLQLTSGTDLVGFLRSVNNEENQNSDIYVSEKTIQIIQKSFEELSIILSSSLYSTIQHFNNTLNVMRNNSVLSLESSNSVTNPGQISSEVVQTVTTTMSFLPDFKTHSNEWREWAEITQESSSLFPPGCLPETYTWLHKIIIVLLFKPTAMSELLSNALSDYGLDVQISTNHNSVAFVPRRDSFNGNERTPKTDCKVKLLYNPSFSCDSLSVLPSSKLRDVIAWPFDYWPLEASELDVTTPMTSYALRSSLDANNVQDTSSSQGSPPRQLGSLLKRAVQASILTNRAMALVDLTRPSRRGSAVGGVRRSSTASMSEEESRGPSLTKADVPIHIIARGNFSEDQMRQLIRMAHRSGRHCWIETCRRVFPPGLQLDMSNNDVQSREGSFANAPISKQQSASKMLATRLSRIVGDNTPASPVVNAMAEAAVAAMKATAPTRASTLQVVSFENSASSAAADAMVAAMAEAARNVSPNRASVMIRQPTSVNVGAMTINVNAEPVGEGLPHSPSSASVHSDDAVGRDTPNGKRHGSPVRGRRTSLSNRLTPSKASMSAPQRNSLVRASIGASNSSHPSSVEGAMAQAAVAAMQAQSATRANSLQSQAEEYSVSVRQSMSEKSKEMMERQMLSRYVILGMNDHSRGDFAGTFLRCSRVLIDRPITWTPVGFQLLCMVHARWLLCLAHSAIICRLPECVFIGDDTLATALKVCDDFISSTDNPEEEVPQLAVWLSQLVYGLLVPAAVQEDVVNTVFLSYFKSGCLSQPLSDTLYLIHPETSLKLPDVQVENASLVDFYQLINRTIAYAPLNVLKFLCCTPGERSALDYHNFLGSMNELMARSPIALNVSSKAERSKICSAMLKLRQELPRIIDMQSNAFIEQMQLHIARYVRNTQSNMLTKPTRKAHRRKGGAADTKAITGRDIDPLWSYLIHECHRFNRSVENIVVGINAIIELVTDLDFKGSLGRLMFNLKHDILPTDWTEGIIVSTSSKPTNTSARPLKHRNVGLREWLVQQLQYRRVVLSDWLSLGYPGIMSLHLFQNPLGLLHSFKESVADSTGVSVEALAFCFEVYGVCPLDEESTSHGVTSALTQEGVGRALIVSGIYLSNAFWNKHTGQLEPLENYSASKIVQVCYFQRRNLRA